MSKLPETFNLGSQQINNTEGILDIIQRMYVDLARAINQKPDIVIRKVDGQTTDNFLSVGTINNNSQTNKVEMLTNYVDSTTVIWTQLSP